MILRFLPLFLASFIVFQPLQAFEWPFKLPGTSREKSANLSLEERFNQAVEAYEREDYKNAAKLFAFVAAASPESLIGKQANFFLGVCYFELKEYEHAKEVFSAYLKNQTTGEYIQETLEYKFLIAEAFRKGAKKHLLGYMVMPNMLSGEDCAMEIYDEIIITFPAHELAAQSLFAKAALHWKNHEFLQAVEAYQTLIRRFPQHELAPESYLMVSRLYVHQSSVEKHNSDLLALVELNQKKFALDFPAEERLVEADKNVRLVKENYARGLFQMGEFYERVSKPKASVVYYKNAISQFPDTEYAKQCLKRLQEMGEEVASFDESP